MKFWIRYLTAWSRHHRSGGFGIHSPYAYDFVRNVWRQPLSYYAYDGIGQLLDTIRTGTTWRQRRGLDIIAENEARLLFRVANCFNPLHILQAGATTGVDSVAMLEVNRSSRLYLIDAQLEQKPLAVRVMQSQLDRIACYSDEDVAVDEFLAAAGAGGTTGLALVNTPVDESLLHRILDEGTVMVMRNLHRKGAMRTLLDSCCSHMAKGQTYTNGKIALLLPNAKLQREDFLLWL